MRVLRGRPIAPGYAEGAALVVDRTRAVDVVRRTLEPGEVEHERRRFHEALATARSDLTHVEQRVLEEFGASYAAIFAAHRTVLDDPKLIDDVTERIGRERINADAAVDDAIRERADLLYATEDAYLRERSHDIRDVGNRVIACLSPQHAKQLGRLRSATVLVAHELLPSETIDLDREHLSAIVTEEGGENSHAAILARSLGVPAITGVARATSAIPSGARVLVDGERGEITVHAAGDAAERFEQRRSAYLSTMRQDVAAEREACETSDGTAVSLLANIGRPEEAALAVEHNLDGVGLFRTEYVFLESGTPPSREQHAAAYAAALAEVDGRPLVVRTLDLGGDKVPAFLRDDRESNPGLGLRGLRYSLSSPELFAAQIEAILDVAAEGDLRVLLPMVFGAEDLKSGIDAIERVTAARGRARRPPVGAMIETPAALFGIDEILAVADFISIGTNDLTQLMLAADRGSLRSADAYLVRHPAMLRAVAQVLERADRAGRPATICGEAAGDPRAVPLLLGMGARSLSMSPPRAARVRALVRRLDLRDARDAAQRAIAADTCAEIERVVDELGVVG